MNFEEVKPGMLVFDTNREIFAITTQSEYGEDFVSVMAQGVKYECARCEQDTVIPICFLNPNDTSATISDMLENHLSDILSWIIQRILEIEDQQKRSTFSGDIV